MMKRTKIILLSIIIFSILIGMLYISYGFFTSRIEGNESAKKAVYNSQIIKVEYSDGTETLTTKQDGYFSPGAKLDKTFTIINTGNVPVKYSIRLTNITNNFDREEDLVYELTSNGNKLYDNLNEVKGVFPKSDTIIYSYDTLNVGESKTYTLTINYLNSEENQIVDSGKTIGAKVIVDENVKSVANLIVKGNSVQESPNLVPSDISSTIGYYFNSSGELITSTTNSWAYTDYISVDGYNFTLKIPSGIAPSICAYDETQTLIKCVNYNNKTSVTISSSKLIKYIRYSYPISNGLSATKLYENLSLDNPVEIESVGNKSKNLFGDLQDKWVNTSGNIENSTLGKITQHIPCKPGDVFTISGSFPTKDNSNILLLSFRDINDNNLGRYIVNQEKDMELTKVAPSNTAYIVAGYYTTKPDWVQLEKNEIATEYEPYNKYVVPMTISSKNVFNQEEVVANRDNWIYSSAKDSAKYSIYLPPGTYTLTNSFIKMPANSNYSVNKYGADGIKISTVYSQANITNSKVVNVTLSNGEYIDINLYVPGKNGSYNLIPKLFTQYLSEFAIYQGTFTQKTIPDYSPYKETKKYNIYLDEPLRKVGNSSDYIDFNTSKFVKRVKELRLQNASGKYKWLNKNGINFGGRLDGTYNRPVGVSNRETRFTANGDEKTSIWLGVNNAVVYWIGILDYLGFTTVDEMNEWLDNNPTYLYYGSSKKIEKDIELPNIDIDANSIVTIGTDIPATVEVDYNE